MIQEPSRAFFVGQSVDALDTVNRWLNGEVLRVTPQELFIHYTGWSIRFDEWFPIDSQRILAQWEPGRTICLNNRIDVRHDIGGWLEARVIEIDGSRVKVHFNNFHSKYDMWVDLNDKTRVAEIGKHSKGFGIGRRRSKFAVKLNELILAKLQKEDKDFRKELKDNNLVIKEMGSDGNCLFRSISDQLYGCEQYHAEIRRLCLEYIDKEKDFFENYVEGDFEDYVTNKKLDGVWGDDVQLQAISEIYDRPIEIFVNGRTPIKTFHQENEKKIKPIKLAYHGKCHYNSIKNEYNLEQGILQTKYGDYEKHFAENYADFKRKRQIYRNQFAMTAGLDQTLNSVINAQSQQKQRQDISDQITKMTETETMLQEIEKAELKEIQLQEQKERLAEQIRRIESQQLEQIKKQSLKEYKAKQEPWIQQIRSLGFSDFEIGLAISARGNDPDAVLNYLYDNS